MKWNREPQKYSVKSDSVFMITDKKTNLFNAPNSERRDHIFPFYYEDFEGDFVIKCKVTPDFMNIYDQGDIIIWEDENKWIKLAYENSDNGYPAIVSVVTNETSDDCTGSRATAPVWLSACRRGNTFALHYSEDGKHWNMVRLCSLNMERKVQVGVSAQCPLGEGCPVLFEYLSIEENQYSNIRNINL